MLNVPWRLVAFYFAADLSLFSLQFVWNDLSKQPLPAPVVLLEIATLARAAALGTLVWWATRAIRVRPRILA